MKNVLAIVIAVLLSAYAIDQYYYQGYYTRNVSSVSSQVAGGFGFRW